MKVAFWSSSRNSGVTSCALAAAYLGAQAMDMRITILDNHYHDSMMHELIAGSLRPGAGHYREPRDYSWQWYRPGYYSGCANGGGYISMELVEEHLWFRYDEMPGTESMYEKDFMRMLKKADSGERICFVDTEGHNNLSTKLILDEADLVVVMLPSNLKMVEVFFDEYSSIIGKSLLVFNKCRLEDRLARKKLCEKNRIPSGRVVTMPYVESVQKMVGVGRFRRFLMDNATSSQPVEGYAYLAAISRILNVIEKEYRRGREQQRAGQLEHYAEQARELCAERTGKLLRTADYGWKVYEE